MESLTIPLSFDGIQATVLDSSLDIGGGLTGFLAARFGSELVPFRLALDGFATTRYDGLLVATRALPADSKDSGAARSASGGARHRTGWAHRQ